MKRITSIDALRAFALFGILLVHARCGFGLWGVTCTNTVDSLLNAGVKHLFNGRFVLIFNILFGVSFYIILNKKDSPASKFVWRCFLLALIGLLNKVFYDDDVLFKYGVCGMLLTPLRKMSNKGILCLVVAFVLAGVLMVNRDFGSIIFCADRYVDGQTFAQFLQSYPSSLLRLAQDFLNGYYFLIYANMGIGYLLGRIGFVELMDSRLKVRHILISLSAYALLGALNYGAGYMGIQPSSFAFGLIHRLFCYGGAAFYSILFVWLYNNSRLCHRAFSWFEPYGKLGLTNYTMQGFCGILIFYFMGVSKLGLSVSVIFLAAIGFFVLQALFSTVWLKHFRNGPLEYLWRCATAHEWLPLKVS